MKHRVFILVLLVAFSLLSSTCWAQGITEELFPQYFGGKNGATTNTLRMNTAFRITLTGLTASAGYRFTAGMVNSADGVTSNGAGIVYVPGITAATINAGTLSGTTEVLTTNGSGNVTFWLVVLTSGNARFEPGTATANVLSLRVGLNDGAGGTAIATRITSTSTLVPLDLSSTARTAGIEDDGAFIEGHATAGAAGKVIMIWDNTTGTGRPLHGYISEDNGITETNVPAFYSGNIVGSSGSYGLVMPSNNPNGVRRIEAFSASGTSSSFSTDADGSWSSGALTANPARGQIVPITADDAPLPIQLASMTGITISNNAVRLDWTTLSEVNNFGFYVQRRHSTEQNFFDLPSGFVPGHGTTLISQHYTFTDNNAGVGRWYYRLKQVDLDGSTMLTDPIQVDVLTGVKETAPKEFALNQNYPNPFNPSTEIKFSVEQNGSTTLRVYNLLGQEVATLFNGMAEAGKYYSVKLDATSLASGMYFYKLESGQKTDMKKMLLLK
jgi:hypothetical protein